MPRSERRRAHFRDTQLYPAYNSFLSMTEHDAGLVLANANLSRRNRHALVVARHIRRVTHTTAAAVRNIQALQQQLRDVDRTIQGLQHDMFVDIEFSRITPTMMAIPAFAIPDNAPSPEPSTDPRPPWRTFMAPRLPSVSPVPHSADTTQDELYPSNPPPQYAVRSAPFPDALQYPSQCYPSVHSPTPCTSTSRILSTPHPSHGILTTTQLLESLVDGQHVEQATYHTNRRAANALRELGDGDYRRIEAGAGGQGQGHA